MPPAPTADAYRAGLLLLQQQQRAKLTALIEQVDGALSRDWQRSMGYAAALYRPVIDAYARELAALRKELDDPSAKLTLDWLTSRNSQLATIERSVRASLDTYGQQSAATVTAAQAASAERGAADAAQLTQRSLWPAVEGAGVPPAMLFNRPNPDAIAQWVGRAGNGHPLDDLFSNFGTEATQLARKEMLLGLATGANPKAMAAGIANALGVSRSRATIISRTEVLGSYRSAAHETYRANSDVISGWLWSAGGNNPCAMCMGMDGLQFSLEEELIDHPCGKCSPIPVTRSWDDILGPWGIDSSDMLETSLGAPGAYETGAERFARMSAQQQRAVIGTKTGYDAYKRGEVTLKDFVGMRPAENGFPAMPYQKSLKEMEIPTGRAGSNLVERSPRLTELEREGNLRYRDFGAPIPPDEMPKWAQQSPATEAVYQILRNGLPWTMREQELPLLAQNLEQMLKEELPLNVRLAALRQQDVLKQYDAYLERYVRHVTSGASTLGKAPEFVYKPSKELERLLAAARAGERGAVEAAQVATADIEQTASREAIQEADAAIKDEMGREATHIAPEDVAMWTANNADGVPSVAYHAFYSEEPYNLIMREGADMNQAVAKSGEHAFLRGLYMTEQPLNESTVGAEFGDVYGEHVVPFAVHMEHPLILDKGEWVSFSQQIIKDLPNGEWRMLHAPDEEFWTEYQTAFRDYLEKHGYDGIIRDTGMTGNPLIDREIIAFKPGTVRVIEGDAERALAAARAGERDLLAATQTADQSAIREADVAIKDELGRAATHIAPGDVAAWTKDNAPEVPSIGYHAGTPEHILRLDQQGIDVARNLHGTWGRGCYMHMEHDVTMRYGPAEVRVAIRMQKPFFIDNPKTWQRLVDKFAKGAPHDWDVVMNRFTDDLIAKGYDGIIVRAEQFNALAGTPGADLDEIIAIKPGTVRVIETAEQAAARAGERTASREAIQATKAEIKEELGRAATHIAPEDVATFAAHNAPDIPSVGFHYGTPEHIGRLGQAGIDVARNRVGAFGRGFYMFVAENPGDTFRYGEDYVRVAIHMENPYRIMDGETYNALLDKYIDANTGALLIDWQERLTADLLKQGYDGIYVSGVFEDGPPQIVAIKSGTVRVIITPKE